MASVRALNRTPALPSVVLRALRSVVTVPSRHPEAEPDGYHLVNDISRVLSDNRNPSDELEPSLTPFVTRISPDVVEQVLKRCKNLGFSSHRLFLWARMLPGFRPSEESYRIMVDVLGSGGHFALLWDFLREMKRSPEADSVIDRELFWLVFRGYSKNNLPGDAVRAFSRMQDEFGVIPGIDDFDKLLYVLCKRKHVRHAQEFFDSKKSEFGVGVRSYSILVRGWGDIGEMEGARRVFDEMLERGVTLDAAAYNSILEALCKGGKVEEAYEMFRGMGSKGVDPNAQTYEIFVRAYCEASDLHSAFMVLDRMERHDLVPSVYTYNYVIRTLCKNEKIEEAYELLDEMVRKGAVPDVWGYNAVLAYHCGRKEVNRSLGLLSRMEKVNCQPDRHSYNMVLKMLIQIGRFDRVEEVWCGMERVGFHPSVPTYSVMVHELSKKRGKLEEAVKYFERMIDEGLPPYPTTVELLHNRLIGWGMLEHIDVLCGKMERSTSCSVREMASAMRGNKRGRRWKREEETELESD
ncbi:hypothetical protein MLD38_030171 [Melastoma candidum]|uniref:Uncharacterized protein n=1 Tax=Melastoma candidum TaxID=119954 RepID=A0ACB9MKY5_9MYRT|nr:hypothetical protein MLD38_030171 [Melastoma candidum]